MQRQLTLTQQIEMNDKIDHFLLEEILLIVQNNQVLPMVSCWGHEKLKIDKADEIFLKKIMLSVNALIKANALRRNYEKIKDSLIEEIEKDPTIIGTNIDILFNKVDAFILIEGFFVQIKTALDLLAQSLKTIYGKEFHTWEKKDKLCGMKIVSGLSNNLSNDIKPHAKKIIDLISFHAEAITRIVTHRDDTVHYGKLNKVQGFRFSVQQKKVIAPLILITDHESAYVNDYMLEVLKYISEFIQEFIITLLSNLINDMKIAKKSDGTWGWKSDSGKDINGVFVASSSTPKKTLEPMVNTLGSF